MFDHFDTTITIEEAVDGFTAEEREEIEAWFDEQDRKDREALEDRVEDEEIQKSNFILFAVITQAR